MCQGGWSGGGGYMQKLAEVEKQRKKATRSSVNIVHGGKCEKSECKQFSTQHRQRKRERQTDNDRDRERGGNSDVGELGVWSVGVSAGSTKNGS